MRYLFMWNLAALAAEVKGEGFAEITAPIVNDSAIISEMEYSLEKWSKC